MQFELLYKELGEYGCLQRWVVWMSSSTSIWSGLLILTSYFVLAVPDHRCAIPGWNNDTYEIQNDYHLSVINQTIPAAGTDDDFIYDQCHYYKVDDTGNTIMEKCSAWVYDHSIFKSSLAADLNMVCDRAIMKSSAQMVNFLGIFFGSILTGIISDKIGRKRTMCSSLTLMLFCSFAMAWSPNYIVFIVLTFWVGFLNVGFWMPVFVIKLEFVGPSHRKFAGCIDAFMFSFGGTLLAVLAYFIRDWSYLLMVVSVFGLIYVPFWSKRLFPESVRWLDTRGRRNDAKDVLKMWGEWNKVELSGSFLEKVFTEVQEAAEVKGNIWHLFSTKVLAIRTCLIFMMWFSVCLGYYGLALNSGDLGLDLFLNFALQALVDIPASIMCLLLLDRTGRKRLMVGCMFIGGAALIGTIFTLLYLQDLPVLTTILAMTGKLCVSAGFGITYIISAELFPTVVRNAGMGASSGVARIGGMIAPYIADLDRLVGGSIGKALPQIVFAALTILGGIAVAFVPETLNKDLPETIEEADAFGRKKPEKKAKEVEISGNRSFSNSLFVTKM